MKLLFLSQGRRVEDQPDFHVSFLKALGEQNFRNAPFQALYANGGWRALEKGVLEANEDFKPDVVFFQFFHAPGHVHPRRLIQSFKASPNHPLILGSLGDPFATGSLAFLGRPFPPSIQELVAEADAFFSTSMGRTANELVAKCGARNLVFLPHGYCAEHFGWQTEPVEKVYDVMMLGRARFITRHRFSGISMALRRRYVAKELERTFHDRFASFGAGRHSPSAHGSVQFNEQVSLFQQSRVTVDAPSPYDEELYLSDRPYFIAGADTSLVLPYVPKAEMLFEPNVHAHFAYRLRDVADVCRKVLELPEDVRKENVRVTREYIHARNMVSSRVDTILSVIEAIQGQRSGSMTSAEALRHLRLWHFRPDLLLEETLASGVMNWVG